MKAAYKVADIVSLALHSLRRHPGRSALTALGVICGVFSVIAMLAINEGAARKSQLLLRELGSNNIIINARKLTGGRSKASEEQSRILFWGLKRQDVELLKTVPGLEKLVIARNFQAPAYAQGKDLTVDMVATELAYANVARVEMAAERFLVTANVEECRQNCVITAALAREFFGPLSPIDKKITLGMGADPFTVVGVLDRLPRAMAGGVENPDRCIIIPLTTHERHLSLFTIVVMPGSWRFERAELTQIIMQMKDEKAVEDCAPIVRRMLEKNHDEKDYSVEVPRELIEQQKAQAFLWNVTFAFIAGVSLLVGGIGIMNIMLASVTERTREIGIRRALGAKRRDIVAQFLTEAVTLTMAGGGIGVGLGLLVPWVVEQVLPVPAVISPTTMLVPFIVAVVVGLASGLYPARRAAMLDPIEALRHE